MGRKARAEPASSAKSLAHLGAPVTWAAFEDVPAGTVPGGALPTLGDAEISLALHALQKKDLNTRLRGVGDLRELLAARPATSLKEACAPFLHIYRRLWPQDAEPRVREGLQRCLEVLVGALQRDFAKHLRSAFPTWLCAMFDTHAEVAQVARRAFVSTFSSDDKRRGVFRHCQAECLELLTANIRHSEQSLHDELGITVQKPPLDKNVALERQDRYVRVIAASLNGLGELVHVCASPTPLAKADGGSGSSGSSSGSTPLTAAELAPFFVHGSACALWPRLAAKQPPLVRRAAAECLVRVLKSPAADDTCANAMVRSSAINTLTDDSVPPAIASALLCSFATAGGTACWDGLTPSKSLWPQILSVVKRGSPRHMGFLPRLPEVLAVLPPSLWAPGRGEAVLRSLLEALHPPSRAEAAEVWQAYFAVVQAADRASTPVGELWRWYPVGVYLSDACGTQANTLSLSAEGEPAESGEAPPLPSSIPPAALAALPAVIGDQLQQLLARPGADGELIDAVTAGAPKLFDTCGAPTPDMTAGVPAASWKKWFALLTKFMGEPPAVPTELNARAVELLAVQVRAVMTLLCRWHPAEGIAEVLPLLEVLGSIFATPVARPECSWAPPRSSDVLQSGVTSAHEGEAGQDWPAEVALLSWPLLPCCRSWLSIDAQAALELGNRVLCPLLQAGVNRHGGGFPLQGVRDLIADALLLPSRPPGETNGTLPEALPLAAAVRLVLECSPKALEASLSPALQRTVGQLVSMYQAGHNAVEVALRLALQPGGLTPEGSYACMSTLVQPLRDTSRVASAQAFRVALFCGSVLVAHEDQKKGLQASEESVDPGHTLRDFREPVCVAIISMVVDGFGCSPERDTSTDVWSLLPNLLRDVDSSVLSRALGSPPADGAAAMNWVRVVRMASTASGMSPALFISKCRGGDDTLEIRGELLVSELRSRTLATGGVLCSGGPTDWVDLAQDALPPAVASLLWELLVAGSILPELNAAASSVIARLLAMPPGARSQFLRLCAAEAAEEGQGWWLALGTSPLEPASASRSAAPTAARLHGLAAFRLALRESWPDLQAAVKCGARELLRWALEDAPGEHAGSPSWGFVTAAIVERSAELGICNGAPGSSAASAHETRAKWRAAIHTALASQTLRPSMLFAAAAVELWQAKFAGRSPKATAAEIQGALPPDTEEPIIAEIPARAVPTEASPLRPVELSDDLDTGVIDAHEQLLRWAQGSKASSESMDAFAVYVAASWPCVVAAQPDLSGSSRMVTRLHRLALELMSDVRKDAQVRACPGAFCLVTALCEARMWPDSSWPAVLQAIVEADAFFAEARAALEREQLRQQPAGARAGEDGGAACPPPPLPVSRAFLDRAAPAAAALLRHAPATATGSVALLGAQDAGLRAAATACLRSRTWVPRNWVMVPEEGQAGGVLRRLEALLRRSEEGGDEAEGAGDRAAAMVSNGPGGNDVAFAVLRALIGPELAAELWNVDAALAAFLRWEADDEGEASEAEESVLEPRVGDNDTSAVFAGPVRLGSNSERMPADCERRCVAALAAWELLLTGIQDQDQCVGDGGEGSPPAAQPPELLARALELGPEQLAGAVAEDWPSGAAPPLEQGDSLIHCLLQLLCHVLTCERLAKDGADDCLGEMLASVPIDGPSSLLPSDFRVFALAARVLLLAFRAMPGAVRAFWEALPSRRDRDLVERLITRGFSPLLVQTEAAAAIRLLEAARERLEGIEVSVARRPRQLALQLGREELRAEVCVQVPDAFPLRIATAEPPERMPGIPRPRIRNWMLQARQVLAGPRPAGVGRAMLMWARSFALFFDGVEDCPICYNVVHLSTQTIPRKACPTCKHKFHSECLYHWFKTSAKTTCPLCNQPF